MWVEIKGLMHSIQPKLQVLVIIIFILIAGLRFETGVDWVGYQDYLDKISPLHLVFENDSYKEIFLTLDFGYALFLSIIKMVGGGIQTVFLLVSILSNWLLLKNLRYNTKYVLTGLLLYYSFFFFIFDLSGLRQGLAIQIVFYAYQFIEKRNFKKYLFYILLAGTIHWTAYVLIVLYFLGNKNLYRYRFYILGVCFIIFAFKLKVVSLLIPNLTTVVSGNELLTDKVSVYTTNETLSEAREWNIFTIFNFIRIIGLVFFIGRLRNKDNRINFFYNLLIIEFICYFGLYELSQVSERLRFYFVISEVILIPFLFYNVRRYVIKDFMFVIISGVSLFNCAPYVLEFPSTVAYHPYQNYVIYSVFSIKSTGAQRLQEHADTHQ